MKRKTLNGRLKLRGIPSVIIALLVLPISLIGFSMIISAGAKVLALWGSAHWVKVPAEIHFLDIITNKDTTRASRYSDGTWYSVSLEYSYNYNGISHTGDRFNVISPDSNTLIYSFDEKEFKRSGPSYCFVNPDNPSESALVRQIPPYLGGKISAGIIFIVFIFWWSGGVILNYMEDENLKKGRFPFITKWRLNLQNFANPFPVVYIFLLLTALDYVLLSPFLGPGLAVDLILAAIFLVLIVGLSRISPVFREKVQHALSFVKSFFPVRVKSRKYREKIDRERREFDLSATIIIHTIFMFIVAAPFVYFGFKMFMTGMNHFFTYNNAANWSKVPVEIQRLEVETKETMRKPRNFVECEYSYTYNGVKYTGEQFDLFCIGSPRKSNKYPSLVEEVKGRNPVYCFVNSANPSEAVLVREIDFDVNLIISFGLFLIFFAITCAAWNILNNPSVKGEIKAIYLFNRKIENPYLLIILFPCGASLVMLILNLFFLTSETTFFVTLGVISLAFITGFIKAFQK